MSKASRAAQIAGKVANATAKVGQAAGKVAPAAGAAIGKMAGKAVGKALSNPATSRVLGAVDLATGIKELRGAVSHADKVGAWFKIGTGAFLTIFNDLQWYQNRNLSGFVNLNFGNKMSTDLEFADNSAAPFATKVTQVNFARVGMMLARPYTEDSDWEQGINELYNTLRSANSGNISVTKYDVERYVWNLRNLITGLASGIRLYNCAKAASSMDTSVPASLIQALGFNPNSVSDELANLRMSLIKLQNKITVAYPLRLNLFDRASWCVNAIYKDNDTAKASIYVPVIYRIQMINDDGTDKTIDIAARKGGITVPQFLTSMNEALAVMDSPVMSEVASIVQKAFGASGYYPVVELVDNPAMPLVYDSEFLAQLQNATVGTTIDADPTITSSVSQTKGKFLDWTCRVVGTRYTGTANVKVGLCSMLYNNFTDTYPRSIITSPKDMLSPAETIMITRLASMPSRSVSTSVTGADYYITEVATYGCGLSTEGVVKSINGTEIVSDIEVLCATHKTESGEFVESNLAPFYYANGAGLADNVWSDFSDFWNQLDWAPVIQPWVIGDQHWYIGYPSCDLRNTALATKRDLAIMHGFATVSLMTVPILIRQFNYETINRQ